MTLSTRVYALVRERAERKMVMPKRMVTAGLVVASDVFEAMLVALDRARIQVHVHSIGDRAARMSLDAVAAARAANGVDGPMHHSRTCSSSTPTTFHASSRCASRQISRASGLSR